MEILIASAIFVAAVGILIRLSDLGQRLALKAGNLTEAQFLCQNKLNEFAAGLSELRNVDFEPFDSEAENDPWRYSVVSESTKLPGLSKITVKVYRFSQTPEASPVVDSNSDLNGSNSANDPVPLCSLTRLIVIPGQSLEKLENDEPETESEIKSGTEQNSNEPEIESEESGGEE